MEFCSWASLCYGTCIPDSTLEDRHSTEGKSENASFCKSRSFQTVVRQNSEFRSDLVDIEQMLALLVAKLNKKNLKRSFKLKSLGFNSASFFQIQPSKGMRLFLLHSSHCIPSRTSCSLSFHSLLLLCSRSWKGNCLMSANSFAYILPQLLAHHHCRRSRMRVRRCIGGKSRSQQWRSLFRLTREGGGLSSLAENDSWESRFLNCEALRWNNRSAWCCWSRDRTLSSMELMILNHFYPYWSIFLGSSSTSPYFRDLGDLWGLLAYWRSWSIV